MYTWGPPPTWISGCKVLFVRCWSSAGPLSGNVLCGGMLSTFAVASKCHMEHSAKCTHSRDLFLQCLHKWSESIIRCICILSQECQQGSAVICWLLSKENGVSVQAEVQCHFTGDPDTHLYMMVFSPKGQDSRCVRVAVPISKDVDRQMALLRWLWFRLCMP